MLPERLTRLLTGFVDGQLSVQEHKQVLELLRHSPEASLLLQHLQADALLLNAFPRTQLPAEFTDQVQANLPKRLPRLAEFTPKSVRQLSWRHAGIFAAAATLLLALGLAFLQKANSPAKIDRSKPDDSNIAESDNQTKPTIVAKDLPVSPSPSTPPSIESIALPGARPEVLAVMPQPDVTDLFTAPLTPVKPLREINLTTPLLLAMREIDQEKRRREIGEELALAPSWRLEFNCQESDVATSRLKRALQTQGIRLLIDPDASDRQTLRFKRTPYAVLVENVSPKECLAMLEGLRQVDQQEQTRARGSNQFIDVKFGRMSAEDEGRLESLFGIKALKPEATKPKATVPGEVNSHDVNVARAIAIWRGQNPSEKQGSARNAFLVADLPNRNRKTSNENQLFLNSRQPPRPGTLQIMIVLLPRKG